MSEQSWTLERAAALDRDDPVACARDRFVIPPGLIYLDGNSLGPLPRAVPERLRRVVAHEWGERLAASWTDPAWMEAPERVGRLIAPLVGARADEVVAADTTTILLTKLLLAVFSDGSRDPARRVLLTTDTNFPTDLYAMDAVCRLVPGVELRRAGPGELPEAVASLGDELAVLAVTHVDFRTGELMDLPALTSLAHRAGAVVLFDLCHSAGAVPVGLAEHAVDLAVGCGYKYLNGGPGAPAFCYVRRDLQERLGNPLPGWIGHGDPFSFSPDYEAARGIRRFLTSTPPVVALAVLESALGCFDGLGIESVRAKSVALTELFLGIVLERRPGLSVASPLEPGRRGSQVSIRSADAEATIARLAADGLVGDFRPPDICRFGFGPLYLSFAEVFEAAERVAAALQPSSP